MTTDNHTPDPAPALLPPARLAEIRERARLGSLPHVAELLAHLDALTPPVPSDGGEDLGRGLYERMGATQVAFEEIRLLQRRVPPWRPLSAENREMYIREALILYRQGYAAGAVAMTGEGDDPGTEGAVLILMERRNDELHAAHAAGRSEGEAERLSLRRQIADIHRIADEEQGLRVEAEGTIARLTAELAEARAALAESEAHAGGMLTLCNVLTAERDTARRDGAREEREACAQIADCEAHTFAGQRIAAAIRARGEGQGS